MLENIIKQLNKFIKNAKNGLPEELFLWVSSITPMVNVDLLIKNRKKEILLAWRDDKYCGIGWHIPGRIVRSHETFIKAIKDCLISEISNEVNLFGIKKEPRVINEIILNQKIRGHFVSFLYDIDIPLKFDTNKQNKIFNKKIGEPGYLKWFDKCPDNLIKYHNIYRKYFYKEIKEIK